MLNTIEKSIKEKLGNQGYFTNLPTTVQCADKQKDGSKCKFCLSGDWYLCEMCQRQVPWCFGGDHEYDDFCDDCFCQVFQDVFEIAI